MFSKDAVKPFVEFGAFFSSGNRLREEVGVRNFNHAPQVETREPAEGERFLSIDKNPTLAGVSQMSLSAPFHREEKTKASIESLGPFLAILQAVFTGIVFALVAGAVGAVVGGAVFSLGGLLSPGIWDPHIGALIGAAIFAVPAFILGFLRH